MGIDIKELFKSDLDPNNISWWSSDKIDKLNHNFNQVSNGGVDGPIGIVGITGGFGADGDPGNTGPVGNIGQVGPQGIQLDSDWIHVIPTQLSPGYMFPRHTTGSGVPSPVTMRIGINNASPEYITESTVSDPVIISKSNFDQGISGINGLRRMNLRLSHSEEISGTTISCVAEFMIDGDTLYIGRIASNSPGYTQIHSSNVSVIKTTIINDVHSSGTAEVIIDHTNIGFLNEMDNAMSDDTVIYNKDVDTDNILTSSDNNGSCDWKDRKDVLNAYPIGSIISIQPTTFNSTSFWLWGPGTPVTLQGMLLNRYGSGKIGGQFEGWYISNGKTWHNDTVSYDTTNLNSFHYDIEDGPDAVYPPIPNDGSQSAIVNGGDDTRIIIGGYDIETTSTHSSGGIYTTVYTNTWNDNDDYTFTINHDASQGTTIPIDNSRMIHIVYLRDPNMVWWDSDNELIK